MKFRNPLNILEGEKGTANTMTSSLSSRIADESAQMECEGCKKKLAQTAITENDYICPHCNSHFRMPARTRIAMFCDRNSFQEHDVALQSKNILGFEGYEDKLLKSKKQSGENEAVITGTATISKQKTAIFVMEPFFMMGSMGSVVGEKITRLFEYAAREKLPVVGFCASGGARMQEGILALMQMAKTSGSVKRHSLGGNLFIGILTNPTTGGVNASFAMLGDIIIAEPNALIGFAGPRVIEQTIKKKLPAGFQRSEFMLDKGFIDLICDRKGMRDLVATLLEMHVSRKTTVVLMKPKEGVINGTV